MLNSHARGHAFRIRNRHEISYAKPLTERRKGLISLGSFLFFGWIRSVGYQRSHMCSHYIHEYWASAVRSRGALIKSVKFKDAPVGLRKPTTI